MRTFGTLTFCLLLLAAIGIEAVAGNQDEPVGARPTGLGGAFTAVADDGNTVFWNPAGMPFLNHHEVTFMHSDLFDLGLKNYYAGYIYPMSERFALGIDWFHLGFEDSELSYRFNKLSVAVAGKLTKRLALGGLLRYFNTGTTFDDQNMGDGQGWTSSLSLFFQPFEQWSAGLTYNNIGDAYISYDNGAHSVLYDAGLRAGVAYRPRANWLTSLDIDDRLHLGAEYTYRDLLSLRGGLQRDLKDEKETVLSFGTGIKFKPFQFDYSYTDYPYLAHTTRISLSAFFSFGYSLVKIKEVSLVDPHGLFPSLWSQYQSIPFIQFLLQNKSDRPLTCSWQVGMGDMMDAPTRGETILRPREEKLVYATAQFSEAFYANQHDHFAAVRVKVDYQRERTTKEVHSDYQAFVYGRNAIDWSTDVSWVGSFINPQDQAAREFAAGLIESNSDFADVPESMANIRRAMLLFDGLGACGLKYLADPSNPYGELHNKSIGIDDVQYAAELLRSLSGDCDDLTVLFCSLLESVGIETAVIDVPGHMFMMFRANLPWPLRKALRVPEHLLIQYHNWIYIPVEVTKVGSGFMSAWYTGAEAYHRWSDLDELNVVDLRDAWQTYPPVPLNLPPGQVDFEPAQLAGLMAADTSEWRDFAQEFMLSYQTDIDRLSQECLPLNDSAVAAARKGDYAAAEALLRRAMTTTPKKQASICNLANLLCLQQRFDEAFDLYSQIDDSSFMAFHGVFDIIVARCLAMEGPMSHKLPLLKSLADSLNTEFGINVLNADGFANLNRCLSVNIDADCYRLSECLHVARDDGEARSRGPSKERKQTEDIQTQGEIFPWHQ